MPAAESRTNAMNKLLGHFCHYRSWIAACVLLVLGCASAQAGTRTLRVADMVVEPGKTNVLKIELDAQGDENAVGFSLSFDPAAITVIDARLGVDAQSAVINVNSNQLSSGSLGLALALQPGVVFTTGKASIAEVLVVASQASAGTVQNITFSDQPIAREVADDGANGLVTDYVGGKITINAAPTMNHFSDQITDEDTPITLLLNLDDEDSLLTSLTVSFDSSNPTLIPLANIALAPGTSTRSLTITPLANLSGFSTITISVTDGTATTTDSFKLTVNAVNDPPVAAADGKSADQNIPLIFPAGDLLANDSPGPADESAQTLTVVSVSSVSSEGGTVSLSGGTITFTPKAGFIGADSFTYTVNDNGTPVASATGTVNVTVNEVNQPPVAGDDTKLADEDAVLSFPAADLLSNDSPGPANESSQTVTVTAVDSHSAKGGSVALSGGTITYTPPPDFNGNDSFKYTVTDNGTPPSSAFGTVNVAVNAVNDPPIAMPDFTTANEDVALPIPAAALLANDSTGPPNESDQTLTLITVSALSAHGGAVVFSAGTVTYTPAADYFGPDTFTYTISDDGSPELPATGTVTITVLPANDPPIAAGDSIAAVQDVPLSFPASDLLSNDTPGPANESGETLSVTSVSSVSSQGGSASLTDGTVTFTPKTGFHGVDTFTYTVSDNGSPPASASGTVTVTVAVANQPPVANADLKTTTRNVSLTFPASDLLANDRPAADLTHGLRGEYYSDIELQNLRLTRTDPVVNFDWTGTSPDPGTVPTVFSVRWDGFVQPEFSETYTFVTTSDDGVRLWVDDRLIINNWTAHSPTVDQGQIPLFAGQFYKIRLEYFEDFGGPAVIQLSWQSSSRELELIPASRLYHPFAEADQILTVISVGPDTSQGGSAILNGTDITYTPALNFTGSDSFSYVIRDNGLTVGRPDPRNATGIVTVAVLANTKPVISTITDRVTSEDVSISVDFTLADDHTAPEHLTLRSLSSNPSLISGTGLQFVPGTSSLRTLLLIPSLNAFGEADISVIASDGELESTNTFHLTVTPVNDAPVISTISSQTILENGAAEPLPFNISDIETPAADLTVSAESTSSVLFPLGSLVITGSGGARMLTVTPALGQIGSATITVRVEDGQGLAATTLFLATVNPRPPTQVAGIGQDGYIANGTVFFDANGNQTRDGVEPTTTTDSKGKFDLPISLHDFDANHNNQIDPSEGTLILTGGTDIATGLPLTSQLTAPPGSTVVSPVTSLLAEILKQNAGLSLADARAQLQTSLGISSTLDVTQYDPFAGAAANDPASTSVLAASAKIQNTLDALQGVLQGGNDLGTQATQNALLAALASQFSNNTSFNLNQPGTIDAIARQAAGIVGVTLDPSLIDGASQVLSELNTRTDAAAAGTPGDAARAITQVQVVGKSQVAADLADAANGVISIGLVVQLNTGENLTGLIAHAPVGDVFGTEVRVGTFEFGQNLGRVTERAFDVTFITVVRTNGNAGAVNLTITLSDGSANSTEDYIPGVFNVSFGDKEVIKTVSFVVTPRNDSILESDETVNLTLALAPGAPTGALLGARTTAVMVIEDDDHPPVAAPDTVTTQEDTRVSIPVATLLANDTDPDIETTFSLSLTSTVSVNGGSLEFANGHIAYFPPTNFFGTDSFTYLVADNGTPPLTATGTVTITVSPENDPPVAGDDAKFVALDTPLVIPVADLLANDSPGPANEAGQILTVTSVSSPAVQNASVLLSAGTVTYTPVTGFSGTDTFTYTVMDNGTPPAFATGTVTLTVAPPNSPPVANADAKSVNEDTALTIPAADLLANDSPGPENESSQTLTITAVDSIGSQGGAVALTSGVITYTPVPNFFGTETFTYTIQDSGTPAKTASATVTITVNPVNDPPTALGDAKSVDEDTVLAFPGSDLTANDSSGPANESSQPLTVTSVGSASSQGGTVSLSNGTITYTPPLNFNGTDTFAYTVSDGPPGSLVHRWSFSEETGLPVLDSVGTANGAVVVLGASDFTRSQGRVRLAGGIRDGADYVQLPAGLVHSLTDVTIEAWITPLSEQGWGRAFDFGSGVGTAGTFFLSLSRGDGLDQQRLEFLPYTIDTSLPTSANQEHHYVVTWKAGTVAVPGRLEWYRDGVFAGGIDTGTASIANVNDAVLWLGRSQYTADLTANAEWNELRIYNRVLSVSEISASARSGPDGTLTTIGGLTATATVTVTVNPVNDPPITSPDSKVAREDTPLVFPVSDLTSNDTPGPANESSQTLTVTSVNSPSANGGTVTLANGSITYTPAPNSSGSDSFVYTVADNCSPSRSAPGTVNLAVTSVNDAPIPVGDIVVTAEDTPLTISAATLTANDLPGASNESGQALTVTAVSSPTSSGGTVILAGSQILYTPPPEFSGTDFFNYTVTDNGSPAASAVATVGVTVNRVNDPPTVAGDLASTSEDVPLLIPAADLLRNDNPGPGESEQSLSVANVGAISSQGGTVSLSGTTITYTPPANFSGNDQFTYFAVDNGSPPQQSIGTVAVTVSPVNDPPIANADAFSTPEDVQKTITSAELTGNDSTGPANESGQTLTVTSVSSPSQNGGTVSLAGGVVTYTPPANFSGSDTFFYTVADNGSPGLSASAIVTINVSTVNDSPVAGGDLASTAEDVVLTLSTATLLLNDNPGSGESGQTLSISSVSPASAQGGTVSLAGSTITYTPPANYFGGDQFTYVVADSGTPPQQAVGAVVVTITEVNDPPVARPDVFSATEDTPKIITNAEFVGNDLTGPANESSQTLAITDVSASSQKGGTVTLAAGVVTYTSPADFSGEDHFTYIVADNGSPSLTATGDVTINVATVNDAPVVLAIQNATIPEKTTLSFTVQATDSDAGTTLSFSLEPGAPANAQITPAGVFTWTPEESQGPSTTVIRVRASDNGSPSLSSVGTFTVIVTEVNDPPVLTVPGAQSVAEDTVLALPAITVADPDFGPASFQVTLNCGQGILALGNSAGVTVTGSGTGSLGITGPLAAINTALSSIQFRGKTNYFGPDTISVSVNDLGGAFGGTPLTDSKQIGVTVTPVNDLPGITPIADQAISSGGGTLPIAFTVSDVETPASALTVVAASSDPVLLPAAGITLTIGAAARTVQLVPAPGRSGAAVVTLTANDADGGSSASLFNVVVEQTVPIITVPPLSAIVPYRGATNISVTAAGTPPLSYQWIFNDAPLLDQTNSILALSNIIGANSGLYRVLIKNAAGSLPSSDVSLTVGPGIVQGPVPQLAIQSSNATFTVLADGTLPFRYQWRADGLLVFQATNSTLVITNAQPSDNAAYSVDVSNAAGETSSLGASLTVLVKPSIIVRPLPRNGIVGGSASFSVAAGGSDPLFYQWLLNGTNLPGQNALSINLNNLSLGDAGDYRVIVTNLAGQAFSDIAHLSVDLPVTITQPPTNQVVVAGTDATLRVLASGTDLHYQWRFNSDPIPGATSSNLVLTSVTSGNEGKYSVDVTNQVSSASSTEAVLTVLIRPTISTPPLSKTNLVGSSVTFTVGASGSEPFSYQWQFKNANLAGQTGSSLTLNNIQSTNAGDYTVIVTNRAGQASGTATLTVYEPVQISAATPLDTEAKRGDTVNLSVTATGTLPFSYQWYFNGRPLGTQTNATLVLANAQAANSGDYSVEVTNPAGTRPSRVAKVKIYVPPTITRQPIGQTNNIGADVFLNVIVSGTEQLSYQWTLNTTNVPGATTNFLRLNPIQAAQAGTYRVFITNFAGNVTSDPTIVALNTPPTISIPPVSQAVAAGTPVSFSVTAAGTSPFSYQWRFDNSNLPGATNRILTINNPQSTNAGRYAVVITNIAGTAASGEVTLTVRQPVQIQLHPASVDAKLGDTILLNVGVTGDGPLFFQWQKDNVNIPNETNFFIILQSLTAAKAGEYRVRVTNSVSSATSNPGTVTVKAPPVVAALPPRIDAAPNDTVTLTASATGEQPFTYQWLLNGVDIPGQNGSSLVLSSVVSSNSGSYRVTVANSGGATTTLPCNVVVATPVLPFADNTAASNTATAQSGSLSGDNLSATAEAAEPEFSVGKRGRKSVWFSWIAPTTGIATIHTRGSAFDTVLAVFTGTITASSVPLVTDEDSAGFKTSAVTFNASAGTTYRIGIDGSDGDSGLIVVNWSMQVTPERIPEIIRQPVSYTALVGDTVEFSVVAQIGGGNQLTYQWLLDGNPLLGETRTNIVLANVQSPNVGGYSVRIRGGALPFQTIPSATAFLELTLDPNLVGPQQNSQDRPELGTRTIGIQRIHPLASVSRGFTGAEIFSTKTAVKDSGEPNHCNTVGGASKWYYYNAQTNGVLRFGTEGSDFDTILAVYTQPGTDFASLVPVICSADKPSVVTFNAAAGTTYFVVVDGVRGARGTVVLNYNLEQAPLILQQPFGAITSGAQSQGIHASAIVSTQNVAAGASIKLSVSATNRFGAPNLSYQWRLNGTDVTAATNNVLNLTNITTRRAGDYTVLIRNFAGSVETESIRVNVLLPVQIVSPPASQAVAPGATVTFSVAATGTAPLQYQWKFGGANIPGATNSSLTVTNAQTGNAGQYDVQVSNAANSVTSSATLAFSQPPVIVTQPQSFIVTNGASINLFVAAGGGAPFGYQWRLNGVNIPGETRTNISLTNIQSTAGGDYTVVVSNLVRSVISDIAKVTVNVPILIVQQPASQTISIGGKVSFGVAASGSGGLSYQWSKDGANLPGATNVVFEIASVQTANAGRYRVSVSNAAGSAQSQDAILTVNDLPSIQKHPSSTNVVAGTTVTFQVEALGAALRFQWKANGQDIPGATNSAFSIASVTQTNAGVYTVLVSNAGGLTNSNPATLSLIDPPRIVQQPVGAVVAAGANVPLSVTVAGTSPFAFQWRLNDVNVPSATNATLTLASIQSSSFGLYQVVVTNAAGSATSTAVFVGSSSSPTITAQPADALAKVGQIVSFSVAAGGSAPFRYQWQVNNSPVAGATGASYTVTNATAGVYRLAVTVANDFGSTNSRNATLTVGADVTITQEPQDKDVKPGESVTFSVVASGTEPIRYQWRYNGSNIPGATNANVTLSNLRTNDAGRFSVVVSNLFSTVISREAQLRVSEQQSVFIKSLSLNSNNKFVVGVSGPPGLSVFVEFSNDLKTWISLLLEGPINLPPGGTNVIDAQSIGRARFYRVRSE